MWGFLIICVFLAAVCFIRYMHSKEERAFWGDSSDDKKDDNDYQGQIDSLKLQIIELKKEIMKINDTIHGTTEFVKNNRELLK